MKKKKAYLELFIIEETLQSLQPSQNDDGSSTKLEKVDHEFKANLEKENNT